MCSPRCCACCPRSGCCRFECVTHCIFDLEGVILDTENINTKACQKVLDEYEKKLSVETKIQFLGMNGQEQAELLVRTYNLPLKANEYLVKQNDYASDLISNPPLLPGVERLLQHLRRCCIPTALTTMSDEVSFKKKTQAYVDLFKVFSHVVCGGSDKEVKVAKPEPDLFLIAAQRFCEAPCPKDCLVFEDSPNGVWAANSARMQVVMVPCESLPCVLTLDATQRLESLLDFRPEEYGLPGFELISK